MKISGEDVIRGWGEIAKYLGVEIRTAQRYERKRDLPVLRAHNAGPKAPVFALRSALDRWRIGSDMSENPPSLGFHLSGAADIALPVLKRIVSMEEMTKLYRRDYFLRFNLKPLRTGIIARVEYRYELCNASEERQPFVQEVTVDDSDHGYVEMMSLSLGAQIIYILRRPPVSQLYVGWAAYRGRQQWINPRGHAKYVCRASWIIQRPVNDIWYNHMILPTIGTTIETHAPATFEMTGSLFDFGLAMKGEHRDIAWRRRTAP